MKPVILQYGNSEQQNLLDKSVPINRLYADKFGVEHVVDHVSRCPDRPIFWEKIAYIKEYLTSAEEGKLVFWIDADSLCVGDEDIHKALPISGIFGMVQMRGGLDGKELISWYNAGFLAMRNFPAVREFLDRVWSRDNHTDEHAINAELRHSGNIIGDGKAITSIDIKWNCWDNNTSLCANPVIRSFHGMHMESKVVGMNKFLVERQS